MDENRENIEKSDQTQTNETAPDDRPESIRTNTRAEMEVVKTEKNFEVQIMHKDQHVEAIKYMSKKDIYEVFKILTVNLVLKKPNDPIRNMIDQLKEIQQEEKNNLESKNEQTNNST